MIPDYFHVLTGWRKFNVIDRGRVLTSANVAIPWLTADPGASVCTIGPSTGSSFDPTHHPETDPCPSLTCSCGYYAYKERRDAEQHQQGQILARVELWGRLVEHAKGYRASRCKVVELFMPQSSAYNVPALAARYHCPISTLEATWISESPNVSSSSNPSASQLQYQNYNQALQAYQGQFLNNPFTPATAFQYPPFVAPRHIRMPPPILPSGTPPVSVTSSANGTMLIVSGDASYEITKDKSTLDRIREFWTRQGKL